MFHSAPVYRIVVLDRIRSRAHPSSRSGESSVTKGIAFPFPRNHLRQRRFPKKRPTSLHRQTKKIVLFQKAVKKKIHSSRPPDEKPPFLSKRSFPKKHTDPLDCKSEKHPFRGGTFAKSTSLFSSTDEKNIFAQMSFKRFLKKRTSRLDDQTKKRLRQRRFPKRTPGFSAAELKNIFVKDGSQKAYRPSRPRWKTLFSSRCFPKSTSLESSTKLKNILVRGVFQKARRSSWQN